MRTILLMLSLCPFSIHFSVAQLSGPTDFNAIRIEITTNKTTHLVFPFQIISVDKGSRDVLAQKTKGAESILQLKAAKPNFEQTNLTVVTSDGSLYGFVVDYNPSPKHFIQKLPAQKEVKPVQLKSGFNIPSIAAQARLVEDAVSGRPVTRIRKNKSALSVNSIYIADDVMFFKLTICNRSPIKYDIESLRFLITDKKQTRRTALQELDIKPLYVFRDTTSVAGNSGHSMVFALPKFTIPDKKHLWIRMVEKNGGRHLHLKIKNKNILGTLTLEAIKSPKNNSNHE